MSRDYAKRSFSRKKSKKSYPYLWLMLLILFAAFITGLVMFNKYKHYNSELPQINSVKKITSTKQAHVETVTKIITKPKFDFYNILPQKKDSKSEIAYELEIATVNDFVAADRLKAELALLGFAASITPIYQQGIQKHHICIGPYDNKDNAVADQQRLKLNKVKSVLKKVR